MINLKNCITLIELIQQFQNNKKRKKKNSKKKKGFQKFDGKMINNRPI